MKHTLLTALCCLSLLSGLATAAPPALTPDTLQESWARDWWVPRHMQKLDLARQMLAKGQGPQLLFIGDSITQGWEKEGRAVWAPHFDRFHALNLGFAGDRTENVLWRLQHGALDGLAPKATVLLIGTNNTGHRQDDPDVTAEGVRRILAEIHTRLPQTRVLLLAIFPREATPGPLRAINEQVNRRLATMADGRRVQFLDINAALTGPAGALDPALLPDWLHLSERGYALWAQQMAPALDKLLRP